MLPDFAGWGNKKAPSLPILGESEGRGRERLHVFHEGRGALQEEVVQHVQHEVAAAEDIIALPRRPQGIRDQGAAAVVPFRSVRSESLGWVLSGSLPFWSRLMVAETSSMCPNFSAIMLATRS